MRPPNVACRCAAAAQRTSSALDAPGKLAREFVKRLGDLSVLDHRLPLVPYAPGQRSGEHRDGEKDEQREQFMRLRDCERVDRLDEEEIVGDERGERGHDRSAGAKADAAEQHRGEEDHRQVGKPAKQPTALRRPRRRRRPRRARPQVRRRAPSRFRWGFRRGQDGPAPLRPGRRESRSRRRVASTPRATTARKSAATIPPATGRARSGSRSRAGRV